MVGRAMFETDRLLPGHVARCNAMDEVWVPTGWARDTFESSGVAASKLVRRQEGRQGGRDSTEESPASEPFCAALAGQCRAGGGFSRLALTFSLSPTSRPRCAPKKQNKR